MSDHVWVSALIGNEASLVADTRSSRDGEGVAIAPPEKTVGGQALRREYSPTKIWDFDGSTEDQHSGYPVIISEHVPEVFYANGHWILSERIADILSNFDLGDGGVYPVSEGLFMQDQVTRIPGRYFSWVFGNMKSAFLPEETSEKRKFGIAGTRWNLPFVMRDENVAVSRSALAGPEVWLDEGLFKSLFLSGPLGDALVDAGLKETLYLHKARVI